MGGMCLYPNTRRVKTENQGFKASLGCTMRIYQITKPQTNLV